MTKNEFIKRYGLERYIKELENKRIRQKAKLKNDPEYRKKRWALRIVKNGRIDLIENYELAKADNFDPNKWCIHHRLENFWSSTTLKRKHIYVSINPEALIWLPSDEHRIDVAISVNNKEKSRWHKRKYEN